MRYNLIVLLFILGIPVSYSNKDGLEDKKARAEISIRPELTFIQYVPGFRIYPENLEHKFLPPVWIRVRLLRAYKSGPQYYRVMGFFSPGGIHKAYKKEFLAVLRRISIVQKILPEAEYGGKQTLYPFHESTLEFFNRRMEIVWKNAVDPSMDFSQRYRPLFKFISVNEHYPERAKTVGLGKVTVGFTMLVGKRGKVLGVRFRSIRSQKNKHATFTEDFYDAVYKILVHKTKLLTKPYRTGGRAVPFTWDNKIVFEMVKPPEEQLK